MISFRSLFFIIILIALSLRLSSQSGVIVREPDAKFARYCIEFKNYTEGLSEYMRLLEKDSNNVLYRYHIGICHVNLNDDKSAAIPWLEWVVKQPRFDLNAWYELGRAYHYSYRFDDAEKAFNEYLKNRRARDGSKDIPARRYLEMIENARELMQSPVNISLHNMGRNINSRFPEYGAYITADESMLIYNSQRFGNTGNFMYYDGLYTADIWSSHFKNNVWRRARRFSPVVNSALIEEIVGMSADGSRVVLYFDNFVGEKMLFTAQRRGRAYTRPDFLGEVINTGHNVYGACLTPDNQTIFFASDRPGGYGKKDIYYSRRLPSGDWGPPENLGDHINTPYNEDMPYIAPDGQTLYFCSQGHNSMGDYDIFKTIWDRVSNTFSQPENLGYPLNTTWDDRTISFTQSGRYAYISTNRGDGMGDMDIYRVIFEDVAAVMTVVKGKLMDEHSISLADIHKKRIHITDSLNSILYNKAAKKYARRDTIAGDKILEDLIIIDPELDASIEVYQKTKGVEDEKLFGKYRPNTHTGNYIMVLPPGEFKIVFKYGGFQDFIISSFEIEDRDNRETTIIDDIYMDAIDTEVKGRHSRQEIYEFYHYE